jgi:hypothetical protein
MDFMTKLPLTKTGFDSIMVVVDSGTKRTRIFPVKGTATARNIANLFESEIFKHHGLPRRFISDRDTKFTSNFWKSLCASLKINLTMSTAYHPQSDGQTEQKNDWILAALRACVNYWQDDWDQHLHKIEFGINDTVNSSTGYTPFYLEYGRHPANILNVNLNTYDALALRDLRATYQVAKDHIRDAQDRYTMIANRRRLQSPFQVGDLVLISLRDFRPPHLEDRPSGKLSDHYSGPYKITELIGDVPLCRLELPSNWRVHPVFHPEKLKMYYWDTQQPHPLENLPPDLRSIETVIAARKIGDCQQVLIKWKNHNPVYNCWLDITPELQQRLHQDLPEPPSLPFSSRTLLEAGVRE